MTLRLALAAVWLAAAAAPLLWWLGARRRVDVWRSLPVPAALLGADGRPTALAGPPAAGDLTVTGALPAPGQVRRARAADGTDVALTGLPGGALAVALPLDPVADRRDRLLAELAPRLAHEVATPLTHVTGHLDLVAREPVPPQVRRSIVIAAGEVTRVVELSRDLLALTAVRAGVSTRTVRPAGALAEEAVAGLLPLADELGADLQVEVPAGPALVQVADGDVIRALRNLVTNALRHGLGQARRVLVRVCADESSVTFAVEDSGPGVPLAQLARLCQPLVRGPGVTGPGSGLGLAIVAEVLHAHGSAIDVTEGTAGARFAFSFARVPG